MYTRGQWKGDKGLNKTKYDSFPIRCRRRSVRKPWKWTFPITPLSFGASSPRNPCEYPHKPYIARNCWATSSSLIVWIYLHSNFRGSLRKTHVFWNRMHNGPSGSSKVVDFGTSRKPVCDFLSVINSKLGPVLPRSEILQVFCSEQRPHPSKFHPNFWGVSLGLDSRCR